MGNDINPLVSVVVPCYNHENYVQDCIESIIDQDYPNIELIIIDDGSNDHSVKIIKSLISKCKRRFLRFEFRSRPNKGLCATLNEALDWCRGEYFSPIASDDLMLNGKIKMQVEYMQRNRNVACVFSNGLYIDEKGDFLGKIIKKPGRISFEDLFLFNKSVLAPSLMARTKVIKDVGGYPEKILIEDWYMWLKITEYGYLIDQTSDFLVAYRRHSDNTSSATYKMHSNRLAIIELFKTSPLYTTAKALAFVQLAVEKVNSKRLGSVKYFVVGVKEKPSVIFRLKTLHYISRLILPYHLYNKLKKRVYDVILKQI